MFCIQNLTIYIFSKCGVPIEKAKEKKINLKKSVTNINVVKLLEEIYTDE